MDGAARKRTPREDPDCEDASATVELAILLPVYLLIVVALLTIGQLVLVRQGMILATRNVAWRPNAGSVPQSESNSAMTNAFIPLRNPAGYGTFSSSATTGEVKFTAGGSPELSLAVPAADENRVLDSGAGGANGLHGNDAMMLALAVMNDEGHGNHLGSSKATGQFAYQAGWLPKFFHSNSFTPTTTCSVYYRKGGATYERAILTQGQDHHPIEDLIGAKGTGNGFSISKDTNNAFFPPVVPDVGPAIGEGNGKDPGIWDSYSNQNPGFRIGGDVNAERQFFFGKWNQGY